MDGAVERDEAEVAFNVAYRVLGSETDATEAVREASRAVGERQPEGERRFVLELLAATRRACHQLVSRRRQPLPAATESSAETIASASMRLPIRQREALALRELGRLSYVEIASVMETGDNAVAQLISRARINLSDELRGTVLASIAAPSPACERALPLIAMRDDGQLEAGSPDAVWLDTHLSACERCRLGVGAMQEAAASYGSWAPIAAPAGLLGATARTQAASSDPEAASTPAPERRQPRRRPALVAGLALLLFLAGLSAAVLRGDPAAPPLDPAAGAVPEASAATKARGAQPRAGEKKKRQGSRRKEGSAAPSGADDTATAPGPVTVPVATEGSASPTRSRPEPAASGEAAVEPTQEAPAPKKSSKPSPAPTTAAAPQPAPEAAPASEAAPPAEEAPFEPPGRKDPPGKAVGREPK